MNTRWQAQARARRFAACMLILVLLGGLPYPAAPPTAEAAPLAGDDVCPEPNDSFQSACNLGSGSDALGFLSRPDDVDAYRIIALDFNTQVTVSLTGQPYGLVLYDWNGAQIAESAARGGGQVLDTKVGLPGTYYVGVVSTSGAFSDGAPYTVGVRFGYTVGAPRILFSGEFREGNAVDGHVGLASDTEFREEGGRYVAAVREASTSPNGRGAWASWGPHVRDFVLTVDTRIVSGSNIGVTIGLRRADPRNALRFFVDSAGRVVLSKTIDGTSSDVVTWRGTTAWRTDGSVNRITIRYVGNQIVAAINGIEVLQATEDSVPSGQVGLGVITWADPGEVYFDNLLVTAPVGAAAAAPPPPRPVAVGDVFLLDNFDNPANGRLPKAASNPNISQIGYVDGEYVIKRVDPSNTGTVGVSMSDAPSNASFTVDARIVGETDGRYVEMQCRRRNNGADYYVMAVMPHSGQFQILRVQDGKTVPPEVWRESAAIRRGNEVNHLELHCIGPSIKVVINGETALEIQDTSIPDGIFVIGAGNTVQKPGLVEVRLDNLVVTRR